MNSRKTKKNRKNNSNFVYILAVVFGLGTVGAGAYFFFQKKKTPTPQEMPPQEEVIVMQPLTPQEKSPPKAAPTPSEEDESSKEVAPAPQKRSSQPYTLISHNTADIQNNPIENSSVLDLLSNPQHNPDVTLRQAAKKLLDIDKDKATYECKQDVYELRAAYEQLLITYYESIGTPQTEEDIQQEVDIFLQKMENDEKINLELSKINFGHFDKVTRQYGATRFSPTFYSKAMLRWLDSKPDQLNIAEFTEHWLAAIKPLLNAFNEYAIQQGQDQKQWREKYLYTFLFDLYTLKRLFNNNGVEAWVTLTKSLQTSSLGSAIKKNRALIELYQKQNPDIICLQECDTSLVKALQRESYFVPEDKTNEGSVILYKKSTFKNATITPLQLQLDDLKAFKNTSIPSKSIKWLTTDEVKIHKVKHKGMVWLVVSFHATSRGDNTLLLLEALFSLHRQIEQQEGKSVLLLLGADANTTRQRNLIMGNMKKDLAIVDRFIAKNKSVRIRHQGKDINTVKKERSTFQVQLNKTHAPNHGISDFIMVSTKSADSKGTFTLKKGKTYLSPHGPNPKDNPSDHKAVGLTFVLEEEGEEETEG